MSMQDNLEAESSRSRLIYRIGGGAGLACGVLLLIAVVSLVTSNLQPLAVEGWSSLIENNWLVLLFKLHAGFSGVHSNMLYQLNLLDLLLMALVSVMFISLYFVLRTTSKVWSIIALAQPIIGIVIYVISHTAGRSAVMGALLVISFVMIWSNVFGKEIASVGILASVLLLAGDITEGIFHSSLVAVLMGIGYVFFLAWLFVISRRLFQFRGNSG